MDAEIWDIGTAANFSVPCLLLHLHNLVTRLAGASMHNFDFDAAQSARNFNLKTPSLGEPNNPTRPGSPPTMALVWGM